MRYRIELKYSNGWDDAGWTDESDEGTRPTRFSSIDAAQMGLDEFFADVKVAVAAGDMNSEAVRSDYRIVEVDD